ncbi:hypothetical protein KFE98_03225 [bacterium SCSIO 12741]|nr:hypothetical protein KFE98_03225 [bacterium SCSIO 12741]
MRYLFFFSTLCLFGFLGACRSDHFDSESGNASQLLDSAEYYKQIQPAKAIRLAHQARPLATNDSLKCLTWVRLGQAHGEMGKKDSASHYYEIFFKNCGSRYPSLEGRLRINLANQMMASGQRDGARGNLEMALTLAQQNRDTILLLETWQSKASLAFGAKDSAALMESITAVRDLALRSGQQKFLAAAWVTYGAFFDQFGQADSSLRYNQKAYQLSLEIADTFYLMYAALNSGSAWHGLGNYDSALYYYSQAENWAKRLPNAQMVYQSQVSLSYLAYDYNKHQEAFERLDYATDYRDSIQQAFYTEQLAELQVRYESERNRARVVELESEKRIHRTQRNLGIGLAVLGLAVSTLLLLYFRQRHRSRELAAQKEIERLEKEKEVYSLQSMLFAQEEERRRIARDLHDSVGALLSIARVQVHKVEEEIRKLTELDLIGNTEEILTKAGKEVRAVAHNMMPGVLIELGLYEAVADFVDKQRKVMDAKIHFPSVEFDERFSNEIEVMTYRIVQELFHNSNKHALAQTITLKLDLTESHLLLDYKDDGVGFPKDWFQSEHRLGLSSIRSRVKFVQGEVQLQTSPGHGVHYHIQIPLKNDH